MNRNNFFEVKFILNLDYSLCTSEDIEFGVVDAIMRGFSDPFKGIPYPTIEKIVVKKLKKVK